MKIIIADSCSLILLSKCTLLADLAGNFTVIIPQAVLNEVVNKKAIEKFPDAKVILSLVSAKKIKAVTVKVEEKSFPVSIDRGEMEALVLMKKTKGAILATDDGKAIKACRYFNLPFIISPRVVLELYRLDFIDFEKAKTSIEKMKIIGRYSADIIADVLLELEVLRNA
ncbi:MAG: hypothetical protein GXP46_05495 [Deferribacteres bacterium]|nr:hypothetical protein [Deferribacteres bacterium]